MLLEREKRHQVGKGTLRSPAALRILMEHHPAGEAGNGKGEQEASATPTLNDIALTVNTPTKLQWLPLSFPPS